MSDINQPEGQEGRPEDQPGDWRPPPPGGWAPPPPPPNWAQTGDPTWRTPPGEPGQWGGTPGQPGQWGGAPGQPGQWGGTPGEPGQWGGALGQPGRGPYQWGPPGGWGPPPGPGSPGGWHYGWSSSRPRRTLPGTVTALLLIVAVLVGLGIGHGVWRSIHNAASGNGAITNPFGNNGNGGLGNGNGNGLFGGGTGNSNGALSGVAATVAGEMVDIDTQLSYQSAEAAGTGIVLTSNGYVLTNNHVIEGATSLRATDIGNGNTYTATVVGYDRTHDVAVIKLQGASGLKTADFGNSDQASVGQQVLGLGNAGGVGGTPSQAAGQILALGQSITAQDQANGTSEKLTGLIETNANIQEGDSGGALINGSGQVIGVITAASTGFAFQTGGNQGFAIPINQATTIASTIRSGQTTSTVHVGPTAFLGVEIDTAGSANAAGAVISSTISGGPAAQAGLGPGDVITSLGGKTVSSPSTLTDLIQGYHPGDSVEVVWTTPGGQTQRASVTLSNGPPQ